MNTDEDPFEPMSGDDLERIDATGSCDDSEFTDVVQTALHYRQVAMDLADLCRKADEDVEILRAVLRIISEGDGDAKMFAAEVLGIVGA